MSRHPMNRVDTVLRSDSAKIAFADGPFASGNFTCTPATNRRGVRNGSQIAEEGQCVHRDIVKLLARSSSIPWIVSCFSSAMIFPTSYNQARWVFLVGTAKVTKAICNA